MKTEWATIDKHGTLVPWKDERTARWHVDQRVERGMTTPGQEKVVTRTISEWEEVKG